MQVGPRRRRLAIVIASAITIVGLLTGAAWVGTRAMQVASAQAMADAAAAGFDEASAALADALDLARVTGDDGRGALGEASDDTLDDAVVAGLQRSLAELDDRVADADAAVGATDGAAPTASDASADDLRAAAERLDEASAAFDDHARILAAATVDTADAALAVRDALAARAAWLENVRATAYREHVWAEGWTPELDACRGSVVMTANYGLAAIGEHWSCTGREFPREAGAYVVLDGVLTGTYRVDGVAAMLDQSTHTTADLPTGHDLLYQTCIDGNSRTMALVALTRVD